MEHLHHCLVLDDVSTSNTDVPAISEHIELTILDIVNNQHNYICSIQHNTQYSFQHPW